MKRTLKVPFLSSMRSSYTATAAKVGAFAIGAVVLFGCPVYAGTSGDVVCDSQGNCCDEGSGNCYVINCDSAGQCPFGSSCSAGGYCAGAGYDGGGYYYDAGTPDTGTGPTGDATVDCTTTGCKAGSTCTLTNGVAQCLPTEDGGHPQGDTGTGGPDGGTGDSGRTDAPTSDASDAQAPPPFTGCTSDNQCVGEAGAGARCLDGKCVAAANECFDTTQCPFVGSVQEECVQGVCTPSCANGVPCPTGYSCDQTTNVCTGNPTPCSANGVVCAMGTTCVEQHCVPKCTAPGADAAADAGPTCTGGLVCVDNGCIPSQTPNFVCSVQGQRDTCANGSICLHHNCYIACEADAGADGGNTCQKADNFNICKPVTTSSGTYDVCGSTTNLGNQCDPTQGQNCMSPAVCIDGYCR